jgi:membrane associated rhomboid family serine protease
MRILIMVANGLTIISSMVGMSFLYQQWWRRVAPRRLVASAVIGGVTLAVTVAQFIWPVVLPALRRDAAALAEGEWWRLVTPLLVQPYGIYQCLFNGLFLVVFLPITERLYGRGVWAIYFVSGIIGQAVNYQWSPEGGGTSTAAFGLMGALQVYLFRRRKEIPAGYLVLPALALTGSVLMGFIHDGHGPGFLAGALVALLLRVPMSSVKS